jgi:drug/metabolite transporter (DMT)-like permease
LPAVSERGDRRHQLAGVSGAGRATIIAVFVTVTLWSSAFAGIRVGLRSYGPFQLVAFRFIVASLLLLVLARPLGVGLPRWRDLPALLALGFSGMTLYPLALAIGEQHVSAGVSSMILASQTIIVATLATIFLGERLTRLGWLGSLIGFGGIAVISLGQGSGFHVDLHVLWPLLGSLSTSVYFVFQKPLLRRYTGLEMATWCIWCGTVFLLPFAWTLPQQIAAATWQSTASVVYLAVFPAAIAYVAWSFALSRAPASLVVNSLYLIPPLAVVISFVWLGERPSPLSLLGGAVTLGGVALIGLRGSSGRSSRPRDSPN